MTKRIPPLAWLGLILSVGLMFSDTKGCSPGGGKARAVTYVHEQRSGSITPAIRAALSKLNEKGVTATEFDKDTLEKLGGVVPKQYVVPLAAAEKVGLPAGVSTDGDRVLKTIKDPTDADILSLAP